MPSNPVTNSSSGAAGGVAGVGGAERSDINITQVLALLERLTPEQLEQLYQKLGIDQGDEILSWLQPGTMHVRSYEKALMQYEDFRVHKTLLLYIPPILIILGTFGNIFSFIILRRKAMLKFSTYFYLMVLAIADTLVLYVGLLRLWIGELTGFDLKDQADWLCKMTNAIGYTVSDFSVWLIIAVTVERYVVVCHPLKANTFCNTQRARKVILGLFGLMLVVNSHFFWTVQIKKIPYEGETVPMCQGGDDHQHLVNVIWPYVDILLYSFLPFLTILVLNALIIRQVVLARRHRQALRHNGSIYEQRRPSHEGSTRLTVMLLTISFAFLLTTLPLGICNIGAFFWNAEYGNDLKHMSKLLLGRTITELLMYTNHSMNFFLYCATGQKFRHQLIWMICYAKRPNNMTGNSGEHSMAMETTRNGAKMSHIFNHRRSDVTEICPALAVKSDMYTPLKLSELRA